MEVQSPIIANEGNTTVEQALITPQKRPSFAILMLLQASAALTQGAATTNFNSDIMKLMYMVYYDITFDEADLLIIDLLNWLSVAILIGSMIASFTLSFTTKYIGFKRSAIIGSIGCTIFNVLQCIPVNPYYFLAMRLLSGYFQTTFTATTIMICGELVEDKKRGIIGVSF